MKQIAKPQSLTRYLVAFATASLLGSLSLGCASTQTSDIRVHSAADKKANIKAYKSYAWYESDQLLHDRTGVWVPKDVDTQAEVEFLVNDTLRKRGLTEVQGEPDLLVSVLIVADIQDVEEIKNKRGEGVTTFDPVGQGEDPPVQWTTSKKARQCARSCSWHEGSAGNSILISRQRRCASRALEIAASSRSPQTWI